MVSFDGGLQANSMTSQRNRAEPSQDGGYALLWQRYDNNNMVAMRYYLLYSYSACELSRKTFLNYVVKCSRCTDMSVSVDDQQVYPFWSTSYNL